MQEKLANKTTELSIKKIQKKLVKIDSYLESDASWSTALLKKLDVLDRCNWKKKYLEEI